MKEILKSDFFEKLVIKLNVPKLKNKTNFFRLLAVSQKAGLGLMDSLNSLVKSEENKGLRMIISDLIKQLTQGVSLADAMGNHDYFFTIDEIELIRASQLTGNMIATLYDIAEELENLEKINQKIKKALIYPVILIVVSILAVALLLMFAIPPIVSIFPEGEIPAITVFMIKASDFLQNYWTILILFVVFLVVLYKFLYKRTLAFKVFIDGLLLKIPVLSGVMKTFYMYKFSKLLSQFYYAGISPILALQLIANIFENFEYKKKMMEIREDLQSGFSFFESMEGTKLFDPILIQIIHVGENTGTTKEVLDKISHFYKDQLQAKIDIFMSFLEPMLMAIIAILIGIIVAAVFIPIANMVNAI